MKPTPIQFPRDGQAHNSIIEWWYFNGHLWDKKGRRYSFMDCLFKADAKRVNIPFLKRAPVRNIYFAHSVVTDIKNQKNYKEVQSISAVSRDSFSRPLLYASYLDPIVTRGFVACQIEEKTTGNFHLKTENLDLELRSQKPVLLENGNGYISVCGRESYYYSYTDLQVSGKIKMNDEWRDVGGKAWMDHQWADVSYAKEKWSWFSLQLENGTDIMCVEYDNGKEKEYLVDLIDKNGKQEHLKKLILKPDEATWQSRKTKTKFPLVWQIEIPEKKMEFEIKALMSDQEMIFGAINYWEGPLDVAGTVNGKKIKGVGFMELVGYPSNYNYLVLAGKEVQGKIVKKLKNIKWKL